MGILSVLFMLCMPVALALTAAGAVANVSAVCVHECDECKTIDQTWYKTDANGSCTVRSAKVPSFYAVAFHCSVHEDPIRDIRDEQTCLNVLRRPAHHVLLGDVHMSFNVSDGCKLNAENVGFLGFHRLEDSVCFGQVDTTIALVTQVIALVLGLVMGWLGVRHSRKPIHACKNLNGDGANFMPGAKQIAMHNVVGGHRLRGILFYRFNQVIANVWLPMALMWIVSPVIVLPLWVILFWVPAYMKVGTTVLAEPRYVVTPPLCSLLGIGSSHQTPHYDFLFSMLRPVIMIVAVLIIGNVTVHSGRAYGLTDMQIAAWVINPVSAWQIGMQTKWGNIVQHFTMVVTVLGTFLHIVLTIPPVMKSIGDKEHSKHDIRLVGDVPLHLEIEALANKICDAAVADEEEDLDRVAALGVETLSKFDVMVAFALAIIDFFAYLYKIYSFLTQGRYFLAAVMTIALTESLTTLTLGGHLLKARQAFQKVSVTGVPTEHFLACCQWDDGLAGIPCLWMTVYGLPLLDIESPVSCISSIFFLITGTKALGTYLRDVTDAAMFASDEKAMLASEEGEEEAGE